MTDKHILVHDSETNFKNSSLYMVYNSHSDYLSKVADIILEHYDSYGRIEPCEIKGIKIDFCS